MTAPKLTSNVAAESAPAPERARDDLRAWRDSQPANWFTASHQVRRILKARLARGRFEAALAHLESFGAIAATELDAAAIINNRPHNLPQLERWSPIGDRIEAIEHHPSFHDCGKAIYEDGRVIATYAEPASNLLAQALFWISSQAGEAGHNCPVACTAGIVKAVGALGSEELKARYMPRLLSATYADRFDGAQFLTEIQGGSDVGANAVRAVPDGDALGTTRWRIHGEKWFCSNADADLILMTARVDRGADGATNGTRGLGLFLVPRHLENGQVNGFKLRRLKDKLGTRSMASGEIDFEGALAYAVGPVNAGFKAVMNHVIGASRLYNSLSVAGLAQRAWHVARGYATHRRAFGQAVMGYPLMQEMIARMRGITMALAAGGLTLADIFDRFERGELGADERAYLRVATNLVKMRTCQHSHAAILVGIETLGGNGAIESFSVLPRLLRDNVVCENWEGTHNTLIAQTLRDFAVVGLHGGLIATLQRDLDALPNDCLGALAPAIAAFGAVQTALPGILGQAARDPGFATLALRPHAEALGDIILALGLAQDIATETDAKRRAADIDTLRVFQAFGLNQAAPTRDMTWAKRIERVAAMTD